MTEWLECVPNFSEGRDPSVLEALAVAVRAIHGVRLLGREMDADHHRAVVTLAGEARLVEQAAFELARVAVETIDMGRHQGVHKRAGALDVCPFVPLHDTPMARAVAAAERVGRRIAEELGVPVFLYAQAAQRPERRVLGHVRNLGFETLRDRMGAEPDLAPDFGPAAVHPTAGATSVGARPFLIAYNVDLASDDLALAKDIARRVRESSGGLPAVQAMGFELASVGRAQVSTNILDFRRTPVRVLYDRIAAWAAEAGVEVHRSELIGLVPAAAFEAEVAMGEAGAVLTQDGARQLAAFVDHIRLPGFDATRRIVELAASR